MPIYEYKCSDCGNVYEKRQKFSDPVDVTCNCEKKAPVSRLTSAPALVFKGSGWYINDYARAGNNGGKNAAKENGSTSSASDSKDSAASAKTDSGTSASSSATTTATPAPANKP